MRSAGYTLVELVVVMVLLSLIVMAVSGGLHFGTRLWETSDRATVSTDKYFDAEDILISLFGSAVPARDGAFTAFDGTPTTARFSAYAPQAFGEAGVVRVNLDLQRSVIALNISSERRSVSKSATLAWRGSSLQLAYLDSVAGKAVWLDRWRDRMRLPNAVRIASMSQNGRWPAFIVRLPLGQAPDCAFDPVSLTCRRDAHAY